MSTNYNVYIGPYIQAFNPKQTGVDKHYGCPNPKCKRYTLPNSSNFCDKCGTGITLVEVPIETQIRFDTYDECKDRITSISSEYLPDSLKYYAFFVPNVGKLGHRLCDYNVNVEEIPISKIESDIKRLEIEFSNEIKRVREVFTNGVSIKWGVITYVS